MTTIRTSEELDALAPKQSITDHYGDEWNKLNSGEWRSLDGEQQSSVDLVDREYGPFETVPHPVHGDRLATARGAGMSAAGDILTRQAAQVALIEARAAAAPGGEYGVFLSAEHQLLIHTEIPVLIAMLRQSHEALHAVLALGDGPDAIGPDGGLISWPRIRKAVEARFGDVQ